ncbi:MAG: bifunctional oligoribonuclease/PAP phosphatase NrnA [Bacteroidales bacterium]|jgi:phosphoesterase RecJ-like protein|nr:bifunctional oligoribonuclease/PAP phosphatase NrnA [Bacteroidales bacterium]
MQKSSIHIVKEQISKSKKIVIISHYNPDGDAVGSSLALFHFFRHQGLDARVILPNPFPDFLNWMPGSEYVLIGYKHLNTAKRMLEEADMLFVVDMNAAHRSGRDLEDPIRNSPAFKVLIDHHPNPNLTCNYQYSTTKTTSTCELVYNFMAKRLKQKADITLEAARCIYTGMITDTGSLSYACNNPNTYRILSHIVKMGVNGEEIHRLVYDNYSESRMKLLGLSLCKRMNVLSEYATSIIYLSLKDLADFGYQMGDTEGFVNYGLSMKTVVFTAFFIQREDRIRISFRSKGSFDVGQFAAKHFGGGGHRNASAANYYSSLEEAIAEFKRILPQYQEEIVKFLGK